MTFDGTLKFDTSLDTQGLQSGVGKIAGVAQQALGVFGGEMINRAVDGLVNMGKAAMESIGSLEQNLGGVETLYGASIASVEEYAKKHGISLDEAEKRWEDYQSRQEKVLGNANNAYQTAGMSANEYMETVNGFAASLTSSLGKYENQAADYADMIVTDMSDNANKMGTDMQMIQNAYSGFAKQNYTINLMSAA